MKKKDPVSTNQCSFFHILTRHLMPQTGHQVLQLRQPSRHLVHFFHHWCRCRSFDWWFLNWNGREPILIKQMQMEINAYFCIYTHLYVYKFAFELVLCFSIHLLANYLPMYFLCICICSYIFLSIRLSACWSLIELRSSIYLVSSWFIHSWTSFAFMFANACSFTLLLCFSTCLFTSLTMYLYLWFVDRCQIYSLLHQFLHASICLFIGQCSICLWVSIHGLILLLCILLFACESYLYLHLIVSWCIYHLQFNYLTYVSIFYLHICLFADLKTVYVC